MLFLDVPVPLKKRLHAYANASASIRGMERVPSVRCWMVMYLVYDYHAYEALPTIQLAFARACARLRGLQNEKWTMRSQNSIGIIPVVSPGLTNRPLGGIAIIVWMSVYDQSAENDDNNDDEND